MRSFKSIKTKLKINPIFNGNEETISGIIKTISDFVNEFDESSEIVCFVLRILDEINKIEERKFRNPEKEFISRIKSINEVFEGINVFLSVIKEIYSYPLALKLYYILFKYSIIEDPITKLKIQTSFLCTKNFLGSNKGISYFVSPSNTASTLCATILLCIKSIIKGKKNHKLLIVQPNVSLRDTFYQELKEQDLGPIMLYRGISRFKKAKRSNIRIGICCPYEIIRFVQKMDDPSQFLKYKYIIDGIHHRTIEMDIMIAIINEHFHKFLVIDPLIVMLSAFPDKQVLESVREYDMIRDPSFKSIQKVKPQYSLTNDVTENGDKLIEMIFQKIKNLILKEKSENILCFLCNPDQYNSIIRSMYRKINSIRENASLIELSKFKKDFRFPKNHIILCIDFTSGNNPSQRSILKRFVPKKQTVLIKIFFVTNLSTPSKIFLPLKCIIDCGLFEYKLFDHIKGISTTMTAPICQSMLDQRLFDYGKYLKGGYSLIKLNNQQLSETIVPEIESIDLSSYIIYLRNKNLVFEDIKYLPKPISSEKLSYLITELVNLGLLDNKKSLTNLGKNISQISFLPPFLSVTLFSFYEKMNRNPFYGLLAVEILLIMVLDENFITNYNDPILVQNFCPESDIVTLFKSINQVLIMSQKERKIVGFDKNSYEEFVERMKTLSSIFMNSNPDVSDDDDYEEDESNQKGILNDYVNFVKDIDITKYINEIIGIILNSKPEWINMRSITFKNINRFSEFSQVLFSGNSFIENGNNSKTEIILTKRPGWTGLYIPGHVYTFSLSKIGLSNTYSGFMIHQDNSKLNIPGVVSLKIDPSLNNDYFLPMLFGYLGYDNISKYFVQCSSQNSQNFYSQYLSIIESFFTHYLVFCPSNESVVQTVRNGISKIEKLIPFIPRSLLMYNESPSCFIEILNNGSSMYETKVHFHDMSPPNAYHINSRSIDFAEMHIKDLLNPLMNIRFALSGGLFSLDNGINEPKFEIITDPQYKSVFDVVPSHLVLLCDSDWSQIPSEPTLEWRFIESTPKFDPTRFVTRIPNKPFRFNNLGYSYLAFLPTCMFANTPFVDNVNSYYGKSTINNELVQEISFFSKGDKTNKFDRMRLIEKLKEKTGEQFVSFDYLNGNIGFSVYGMGAKEGMESLIISAFAECGISIARVEKVQIVSFTINYYRSIKKSEKEFLASIQKIIQRFDNLVINYQNRLITKQKIQFSHVKMILTDFIAPFALEICKILTCDTNNLIRIPFSVIHSSFISFPETRKIIFELLQKSFPDITNKGHLFFGSKESSESIITLLNSGKFDLRLDYDVIPIRNCKTGSLRSKIATFNKQHQTQIFFDAYKKTIVALKSLRKEVEEMLDIPISEPPLLYGCVNYCEEPLKSSDHLTVLHKDSKKENQLVCLDCYKDTIKFALLDMMEDDEFDIDKAHSADKKLNSIINIDSSLENECYFPQVSLGQLLWILMKEKSMYDLTRYWVNGVMIQAIHTNKHYFTCCPIHPTVFYLKPKPRNIQKCSRSDCQYEYCHECHTWHIPGSAKCTAIWKGPKCPQCHVPTIKEDGCNRIPCRCGCHWCYCCGAGFSDSTSCYAHLNSVHGGYWNPVNHQYF